MRISPSFCPLLAAVSLLSEAWGNLVEAGQHRVSSPLSFSQVRLEGELGARYSAATCNLLTRTDRYSLESFAASAAGRPGALWWDWPGDQIGRWLSVLQVAEGYGWTPAIRHRQAVANVVLPLQTEDGRFGPPGPVASDDIRLLSGNAFALRGLMDAYGDTRDNRFLDAARRLARYFETTAPTWETRRDGKLHEFYGHCLDGLVALYEQGNDRWALALAERLARRAGRTPHTHHSLSLCRGLLDLARVTEEPVYLQTVEDYLSWCREHQTVTGGLPESMPQSEQDEGCGLADWVVVNLMMYPHTSQEQYLDSAEHTLVNHFFMNQFHTGGFGHRALTQDVVGGKGWQGWDGQFGSENPGCCSLWGQWALGQVGRFIVTQSHQTLEVNLYPSAQITLPDRGMRIAISSDFPRMTRARIQVESAQPQPLSLALRVPPWARAMNVRCDGMPVDTSKPGRRVLLSLARSTSTLVDIDFIADVPVVVRPAGGAKGVALFDGPLCLGLSSRLADVDLPWSVLVDASGRPILNGEGRPQVANSSGSVTDALEPISAGWLTPDVRNPARRRVVFQMKPVPEDFMTLARTNAHYAVALNGEDLVRFSLPELKGSGLPRTEVSAISNGWQHVRLRWDVPREVAQDELSIRFDLAITPDFWWAPHLAPEEGYVVAQHVFRAPALLVQRRSLTLVLMPDLDAVGRSPGNPWFVDYDAPHKTLWLGMSRTEIPHHVLFKKTPGMKFTPGTVELGFFLAAYHDRGVVRNPWSKAAGFQWERWGRPLYAKGEPISAPLHNYVSHTYDWAFDRWGGSVWQEFDLGGVRVGAPQFIVNISQSPNYPGPWYQREFLSIWNQAWFSSLRSASGLHRFARKSNDRELLRKASLTKELALAAPMTNGLFPAVIGCGNVTVQIDGKDCSRPRGWPQASWSNSNRSPQDHGISSQWFHVLDASWTALLMLRWHEELEKDGRLLDYARAYGDRLLTLQDPQGFFPGWLHPQTLQPGPVMNQTPETSMSVTFLLKLAALTGQPKYRIAAVRAMDAVLAEIVPQGRWEDFETYWSCCGWGRDRYLGKKIERNAMHKQNSLATFWTAEALLATSRATGQPRYLQWGRRTLDELSMGQQVWQPPFIHVPALGGFGVMNTDGEWNDSRETLFAELFLDYYRETGDSSCFERGIAALKSGFIMMYCPENPAVRRMWEKVYPWFGPEDYGFTMENYGHGGRTSAEGEGMGVFTIYDWGNGAAAEAAMRILDHFGHVYIDRKRGLAFGIDKVRARRSGTQWELVNETGQPRSLRVVFDDGTAHDIRIRDTAFIPASAAE